MCTPPKPLVLVACGAQKLPHAAAAQDLYTGDLFKKSRAWAERFGSRWMILSAKHGLVAPDQVIEPYDVTLNLLGLDALAEWDTRVSAEFARLGLDSYGSARGVVVLAGRRYRRWIESRPGVEVPMRGLGIGQQKAWLRDRLA
ncbi:hypothetical protein ABIC83_002903 [Roseateles asaccharophilus]|uniref:DUF6884 domain-containing protein n=1 Tax=Roseateles asaccharophilus TaxID=582607 RepID=UPI003839C08E